MPRVTGLLHVLRSPGLRRLWPYVKATRKRLVLGILCAMMATVINYLNVGVFKEITDSATGRRPNQDLLDTYARWLVFLFLIKGVFSYGQTYFVNSASQRVLLQIRNEIYEHLQALGIRFFDQRQTGNLMASITADVPQIQTAVGSNIVDSINAPFTIVAGIGAAIYLNWRLALLSAAIIPLMSVLITLATRRMRRATHLMQTALAAISVVLEETLAGIRVVRAFVAEKRETERFVFRSRESLRAYMRGVRIQAALRPTIELIGALGITMAIWMGVHDILHKAPVLAGPEHYFTFGMLLAFIGSLHYVSEGFRSMGGLFLGVQQANVVAERVFALRDEEPEIQDRPGAEELGPLNGRVEFRDVVFAYGTEPVLRRVSLTAEPGEVVAIVGPSGAGKSTIANLVPRFYDVNSGAVLVDGRDVRDVTAASLRRQIGIVPQESMLFSVSIRENIAYGNPQASEEEVRDAARSANALEFIEAMPDGLDTVVGQRGSTLSGGQRQRVAIARALLSNPRILVLDEATSSLDAQSEAVVQAALERLMQGRTTLVIAHRLSTVRNADRILVLSEGKVAEEGRHSELLARGGLYAELYRRQTTDPDRDDMSASSALVAGSSSTEFRPSATVQAAGM
jgi:subfamily B ATP-binding cassette protein MsbA